MLLQLQPPLWRVTGAAAPAVVRPLLRVGTAGRSTSVLGTDGRPPGDPSPPSA